MTNNHLTLFCIVDGESVSHAFKLKNIPSSDDVDDLKDLIKTKQSPDFDDVVANKLTLWRVTIPEDKQSAAITIDALRDKTELNDPRELLSELFPENPDRNTYIIVQRPPHVHTPVPARVSTPLSGYLSDNSRPGTPLSGDLRADIKKITDKFFAPGTPITDFLDAYVRGELKLP
ncbi:hypothetical protein BG006_001596, partial [Podila minutissima]